MSAVFFQVQHAIFFYPARKITKMGCRMPVRVALFGFYPSEAQAKSLIVNRNMLLFLSQNSEMENSSSSDFIIRDFS